MYVCLLESLITAHLENFVRESWYSLKRSQLSLDVPHESGHPYAIEAVIALAWTDCVLALEK